MQPGERWFALSLTVVHNSESAAWTPAIEQSDLPVDTTMEELAEELQSTGNVLESKGAVRSVTVASHALMLVRCEIEVDDVSFPRRPESRAGSSELSIKLCSEKLKGGWMVGNATMLCQYDARLYFTQCEMGLKHFILLKLVVWKVRRGFKWLFGYDTARQASVWWSGILCFLERIEEADSCILRLLYVVFRLGERFLTSRCNPTCRRPELQRRTTKSPSASICNKLEQRRGSITTRSSSSLSFGLSEALLGVPVNLFWKYG